MRKMSFVRMAVLGVLLALSILSPATAHNPEPWLEEASVLTPTPPATPPAVPTPEPTLGADVACPPGLWISVDRGEGAIYRVCDPITICYGVPYPVYIRIWVITAERSWITLEGYDDGTGGCYRGVVGKPLGIHTLRIQMIENGCVTAEAETWFYVCEAKPLSVQIWTDRGEGSTYRIGDPMLLCYSVSRPAYVEIWKTTSAGSARLIAGYDDGTGDCLGATVGEPPGIHTYYIYGYDCPPSSPLASDQTWVNVFDPEANRIIVPQDGMCRVTWVDAVSNECSGDFGLHSPQRMLLFSDYKHRPSPDYKDIGPYSQGTELVFYIRPSGWCGGEYLSTSQNARVTRLNSDTYRIEWEDQPPGQGDDWDDLIVDVQCGISAPHVDLSVAEWPIDFTNKRYPFAPNNVTLEVDVLNKGTIPAPAGAVVSFYDGDPDAGGSLIGSQTLGALDPTFSATASVNWSLSGNVESRQIYARVYPPSGYTDSNQSNNTTSRRVSIYYVDFRHDVDAFRFANWGLTWEDIASDLLTIIDIHHPEDMSTALMFPVIFPVVSIILESGGHCYGMASTSILYKEYPEIKPVQKSTYDMTKNEASPDIRVYHRRQLPTIFEIIPKRLNFNAGAEYNSILHHIKDLHEPIMLLMYSPGHAVVAYKIIDLGNEKRVYVYDNNAPLSTMSQALHAVFQPTDNTFSYQGLTEGYAREPALTMSDKTTVFLKRLYYWIIENIIKKKVLQVFVDSPVTPLIIDQYGRRIGYVDGSFVNEIPGASMSALGDIKTFDLPWDLSYTVKTRGTQTGTMDLNFIVPINEEMAKQILYDNVPVSVGSQTQTPLRKDITDWTMLVDGKPRQPDEVVDITTIYKVYLPCVLKNVSR